MPSAEDWKYRGDTAPRRAVARACNDFPVPANSTHLMKGTEISHGKRYRPYLPKWRLLPFPGTGFMASIPGL